MVTEALVALGLGWALLPDDECSHVVPRNDLKPHILSPGCWCRPVDIAEEHEDPCWSHNSMDQRENTIEKGIWQ